MNTPKHIQLLEYLAHHGIGVETDVSDFMKGHFKKPITISVQDYNKEVRAPILFLQDLSYRGLIAFDGDEESGFDIERPFHADHFPNPKWYGDFKTNIYVTSKGLDYLDKYEQNQINAQLNRSYVDINRASKKNYKSQVIIGAVTIALTLTSATVSILTYVKADTTAASVDRLRIEIQKLRTQKIQTPSPLTLSQHPLHKP